MSLSFRQPGPRQHNPSGVPVRLQELLADRVMFGESAMDADDLTELHDLERQFPTEAEQAEVELGETVLRAGMSRSQRRYIAAAGAIPATLPTSLRASMMRDADLVLSGTVIATGTAATATVASTGAVGLFGAMSWKALALIGWTSAVAALLATFTLAVSLWQMPAPFNAPTMNIDENLVYDAGSSPAVLSYQVAKAADAQTFNLAVGGDTPTAAAKDLSAYVLWSQELQAGLLHLNAMPANDAAVQQYQAWIVDADRPEIARRVDAGVFNIVAGQPVHTVALRAKLPVGRPVGIVVTLEAVGGSVNGNTASAVILTTESARQ